MGDTEAGEGEQRQHTINDRERFTWACEFVVVRKSCEVATYFFTVCIVGKVGIGVLLRDLGSDYQEAPCPLTNVGNSMARYFHGRISTLR